MTGYCPRCHTTHEATTTHDLVAWHAYHPCIPKAPAGDEYEPKHLAS